MRPHTLRKSVRLHSKRKRRKKVWMWTTLGILLGTAGFLSVLLFAPLFRVSSLLVLGAERVEKERVEARAQELAGRSWGLIKTRAIFLVPTRAMETTLLKEFSEIEAITVSRDFPRTVVLTIQERVPKLLVCGETACVAVDEKGIGFAPQTTDNLPKVIVPVTELTKGSGILSANLVSFFLQTVQELQSGADERVSVELFRVKEEERVEVDTREGWTIVVSPTSDFAWQFAKLKAVLGKQISPAKRARLEYIDLRFGDRAFIKYR